jgi:hypothetical protein
MNFRLTLLRLESVLKYICIILFPSSYFDLANKIKSGRRKFHDNKQAERKKLRIYNQ